MKFLAQISLIVLLTFGIGACQFLGSGNSSKKIEQIKSGYSFGECTGLCKGEFTIHEEERVLLLSTWDENDPPERYEGSLDPSTWVTIQNSIDLNNFCMMEDVYGCPDCADGGAEYLSFPCDGVEKTVTFEFGSTDLEEINALLEIIRPLRNQLEPDGRF